MANWLETKGVPIADAGEAPREGYEGDRDENGDLIMEFNTDRSRLEPKGFKPSFDGRNAWPEGTRIYVKPRLTTNDLNLMNRLEARLEAVARAANAEDLENLDEEDLEVRLRAIIDAAIVVKRFECPIKPRTAFPTGKKGDEEFEKCNAFEDPETRPDYVDDENPGTEGTGEILSVPSDIAGRIRTIGRLPAGVTGFIQDAFYKQAANPLPGSRAVKS